LRIIDLSAPLSEASVVFPGDPRPRFERLSTAAQSGVNLSAFTLGAHNGVHVDAPLHVEPGGLSVDRLELGRLWGRARLWDVSSPDGAGSLKASEGATSGLFDSNTAPGPLIAVVRTGWRPPRDPRAKWLYPWPSIGLIDWLMEKGICSYMTDAPGVDPVDSRDWPVHRRLLGRGVPIVENLHNLDYLPEKKDFTICALPIKLEGLEAAPCRAAAWLDP
jgi:kynurenine formamidase